MFYKSLKNQAEQFLAAYKSENPATYSAAQQAIGGLLILDGFIGIDDPLGGKKRSGIFGALISIVVGLVFVFGMGFISNLMGINKLTATTTATVVSVSQPTVSTNQDGSSSGGSCTPQAKYTVAGKEYTQTASSGSSSACSLTAGKTIEINYDPNNPGAWAYDLNTTKTVLKFFPYLGILVAISGFITFLIRLFSILFGYKLLTNGRALAKTLPPGTDLSTIQNEIRQNFAKTVFGMGGQQPASPPAAPPPAAPQPPAAPPAPPTNPTPPTAG